MKIFFILATAAFLTAVHTPVQAKISVESLNCNYLENPCAVAPTEVRFGWTLCSEVAGDAQSAFQIMVASDQKFLLKDNPDMWSSGKIRSGESRFVRYAGKSLAHGKRYWWKVRVWDLHGKVSEWSGTSWFVTSPDDGVLQAQWIGAIRHEDSALPEGNFYHTPGIKPEISKLWDRVDPLAKRSILLRRDFAAGKDIRQALVHICGLGHYELWVNGRQIDTSVFQPLWSEYDKTVYYNTFDIAPLLCEGTNTLGVMLGNGMYNVAGGRYTKFRHSYGPPTLFLQADITYSDGRLQNIMTDGEWKYELSPVTFNCISGGEDYDAGLEQAGWNSPGFDDSTWKPAVVQDAPAGKLTAQTAPPVRVSQTYGVAGCVHQGPQRYLFDMGQNISGYPTLKIRGKKGQKVRLVPGEQLDSGGTAVNQVNTGSPYCFEYTLRGEGIEEWSPSFAYYGYRYIEVEGADWPEGDGRHPVILDLTSNFIHSSAAAAGSFECSNPLFNRIHYIIDKAMRSNMHAVMTDCPHREKLGWLGDAQANSAGLLYNYDMRTFIPKIMRDIADAQHPDGLVPDIAPEYVLFKGGFADTPEWGAAVAIFPWRYYEYYGDDSLIRQYYPAMRRYADYLSTKAEGRILAYGLGDWCDYGPQPAGQSQNTLPGITATGHYYIVAHLTAKSAALAGDAEGAVKYERLASEIADAFNARFFNPATSVYGNGSQCSYAIPLHLGFVQDGQKQQVIDNLLAAIDENEGKLSTGLVGNRFLFRSLADNGLGETIFRMHNHTEVPGYGYQVAMGVTTLTEQWDPERGMSWNHFMMGQIDEWFYGSLAGIQPDPENPGFSHFFIRPSVVGDLTWAKGSYNSIFGLIESDWKTEEGIFTIRVRIPVGSVATVVMPFGGETHRIGSGEYVFNVSSTNSICKNNARSIHNGY